jgi:predicted exporter
MRIAFAAAGLSLFLFCLCGLLIMLEPGHSSDVQMIAYTTAGIVAATFGVAFWLEGAQHSARSSITLRDQERVRQEPMARHRGASQGQG